MNLIRQISQDEAASAFTCGDEFLLPLSRQQTSRASACMRNSGGVFLPALRADKEAPPVKFGWVPAIFIEPIGLLADWQNHPLWKS
jgi:hypothetical protein